MRRTHGFTLLEMLVVLAILGIIMAVGLTTFAEQSRQAAIRSDMATLSATLEIARSSSIRYNVTQNVNFTGKTITTTANGRPDKTVLLDTCSVQSGLPELRWNAPLAEFSTATDPRPSGVAINLICPSETRTVKVIGVTGKTYY